MKPEKAMTLEDLASHVGVSRSLVSLAFTGKGRISPKTKERILAAARELDYQPNVHAQRLAGVRNQETIGLFSSGLDFGVTTHKIKIIQQELSERGFRVPLYAYGDFSPLEADQQAGLLGELRRQQPRAIVSATRGLTDDALQELGKFRDEGGIVVSYDYVTVMDCDQVIFDREDNNYQSAKHLLELGHRDIGLYMEGEQQQHTDMRGSGLRVTGFLKAMREYGAPINPAWLFNGGRYEEGGLLLAAQFLSLDERPTAICIVNDRAASAFLHEVMRAGIDVPGELSVVCHDDQPVARCSAVPLTSTTQPVREIAQGVIEMLTSRFDETYQGKARQKVVRGSFIERASTAPPRAKTTSRSLASDPYGEQKLINGGSTTLSRNNN